MKMDQSLKNLTEILFYKFIGLEILGLVHDQAYFIHKSYFLQKLASRKAEGIIN